jgi:hypothetical protein
VRVKQAERNVELPIQPIGKQAFFLPAGR